MAGWLSVILMLALAGVPACASSAAQSSPTPAATPAGKPAAPSPSPLAASPIATAQAAPTSGDQPTIPTGARGALDQDALVARALADASTRTGLGTDAIRVVQVEPREWPSSGLGCEKPGMGYAQVITPGYRIVLEAGGRILEYHTDRARAELCTP